MPFKHWNESTNFIFLSIAISVVFSVYTSIKYAIPNIVPFYLDPYLVEIDKALSFGIHPWQVTHYIFSTPLTTGVINFFYNIWFFIIWIFLISFMCYVKNPKARKQAILSFLLCWIINGNIAALLLSSVGPCFYNEYYGGSDPYFELMQRLNYQNSVLINQSSFFEVWALALQDTLWESYSNRLSGLGMGISALPSMHVSTTSIIAMSIYSLNKRFGVIAWIYVLLIMIGSVHLGWHYAVDSYLALFLTSLIWFSVKKYIRRTETIH
ncbi:phosphatase PAP2 family protein [Marinomonas gallaica]|uniref:phosphatase PAP2 family protein n=1 Tax=Marinomonas gallaica TaxID=1806667 RepID=UPI003CE49BC9